MNTEQTRKNIFMYTKCNLVSVWGCEKPLLKKVRLWFRKDFELYPHFIVYDFEAILAPVNEHNIDDWPIYQDIHP